MAYLDNTGLAYFWGKIKAWASAAFAAATHSQASSTINAMTGYSKPGSGSAISASDSLNAAIGKLEAKVDVALDDSNYVHLTGNEDIAGIKKFTEYIKTGSVELTPDSSRNHGGYIDFHYSGEQTDYSSRIVEYERGIIDINGVKLLGNCVLGGLTGGTENIFKDQNSRTCRSLIYTTGQITKGSEAGQAYAGSSADISVISYPANGTSEDESHTRANIQNLRIGWGTTYWHDLFMSPNNHYIWHRDVVNSTALPWRRIVEENADGITAPNWDISIAGNAATATKLAAARNISLEGAVVGTAGFDGSGNTSIQTRLRSCVVGALDGSTNQLWYKVASYTSTTARDDIEVTFYVENTYLKHKSGILRVHARCETTTTVDMDVSTIRWLSTTFENHSDFILVRPDSNTSSVEIWTCISDAWISRRFTVLSEGSRTASYARWTLFNNTEGRAASPSAGTVKYSYTDVPIFTNNVKIQTTNTSNRRTVWLRQDNTDFYILTTNANDPNGTFNSLRPFYITLADGHVHVHTDFSFMLGNYFPHNSVPSSDQAFRINAYDSASSLTHQIIGHRDTSGVQRFFIRAYCYNDTSKYTDLIVGYNPVNDDKFISTPKTISLPNSENVSITQTAGSTYVRLGTHGSHQKGSSLFLYGNSVTADDSLSGIFRIRAAKNETYKDLVGKSDGTLTWGGNAIQVASDERIKTSISDIPENVLDAWDNVEWIQYKYKEAVQTKGDSNCRYHTGLIAQRVDDACSGADILKYGILCHDTDSMQVDADTIAHNDLWTIRYTEALCMEAAYQRRENARLKKRVADLEERLAALELKIS